jgi:hypothetical protein
VTQWYQEHDCGPANVAMVLDEYGLRPFGYAGHNAAFMVSIRASMGKQTTQGDPYPDTSMLHIEGALNSYGVNYTEIAGNLTQAQALASISSAVNGGNLVIVLVNGANWNRYGGGGNAYHWVLVTGVSGSTVIMNDPDNQSNEAGKGWTVFGGQNQVVNSTVFQNALVPTPTGGGVNTYGINISGPTTKPAAIVSPAPGSTLSGSSVTFTRDNGSGVQAFYLYAGTTPNGTDLFNGAMPALQTISNIPTVGGTIYLNLYSYLGAAGWQGNSYTYTEAGATPCVNAAISSNPAAGTVQVNSTVFFTASATCGGTPNYSWLIGQLSASTMSWTQVTPFQASNAYNWTPTSPGSYYLAVWVRNAGTNGVSGGYDAATVTYRTVNATTPCSNAAISSNPPNSSTTTNSTISFTASATCGATANYSWWVGQISGSTINWTQVTPYQTSNAYNWTPTAAGSYYIAFWVKNAGTNGANGSYDDSGLALRYVNNPTIQLTNGVPVSNQSVALGQNNYYYIIVPSGSSQLQVTISGTGDADLYVRVGAQPTLNDWNCRPYLNGSSETCTFANPAAAPWFIMVNGYASATYTVTATYSFAPTACTSSGITSNPSSANVTVNSTVTFTAQATCGGTPNYSWWVGQVFSGAINWSQVTGFQTSNAYNWTPTSTGTYYIAAWIKNAGTNGANGSYDAAPVISKTVTNISTNVSVTVDRGPNSTYHVGDPITVCYSLSPALNQTYTYNFYKQPNGNARTLWLTGTSQNSSFCSSGFVVDEPANGSRIESVDILVNGQLVGSGQVTIFVTGSSVTLSRIWWENSNGQEVSDMYWGTPYTLHGAFSSNSASTVTANYSASLSGPISGSTSGTVFVSPGTTTNYILSINYVTSANYGLIGTMTTTTTLTYNGVGSTRSVSNSVYCNNVFGCPATNSASQADSNTAEAAALQAGLVREADRPR